MFVELDVIVQVEINDQSFVELKLLDMMDRQFLIPAFFRYFHIHSAKNKEIVVLMLVYVNEMKMLPLALLYTNELVVFLFHHTLSNIFAVHSN